MWGGVKMEYKELVDKTKEFYKTLEVNICDEKEDIMQLAITSLTMSEFEKQYNDAHEPKIYNNRSLATVGDSICAALLMLREFSIDLSMEEMTKEKSILKNGNLNSIGEKLLKGYLFAENNDLKDQNKKAYATAFEAVIGFLAKFDLEKAKEIFNKHIR